MKPLRVAVLLFGLPRAADVCVPTIQANVVDALEAMREVTDVKVFYHLYQQQAVFNPRSGENGPLDPAQYEFFASYEGTTSTPDETLAPGELAAYLQHGDAINDEGRSLRNLLLQLHSLQQVTALAIDDDFDVFIFARADLSYHDAIDPRAVRFCARHAKGCVIPEWQWWSGCNDRFAICGPSAARTYGFRLQAAAAYCAQGPKSLHAETFLHEVLRSAGVKLRVTPARASRIRLGGVKHDEDFNPMANIVGGRRRKLHLQLLRMASRWM